MEEREIKEFFEQELKIWDLARKNCEALKNVKRKQFKVGDLKGYVQFNPARAVSTLAKLDKNSIKERQCFLCKKNRPKEQRGLEILNGWELLVNPFPILHYHFTIVKDDHVPQNLLIETGKKLASLLKGFVVFFNDDGAGASAPDHMHFQAVPLNELPLIQFVLEKGLVDSKEKLPYKILSEEKEIEKCEQPQNVFFWTEEDRIQVIGIPRKMHRPKEFFMVPPNRRAFSPGAIDMAGVLVTPYEEDFNSISEEDIKNIYCQVGLTNE